MTKEGFKNKIVVITGAASGIGFALCKRFADGGAKICLLDMDDKALKGAERELTDSRVDCLSIVCNVSSRNQY